MSVAQLPLGYRRVCPPVRRIHMMKIDRILVGAVLLILLSACGSRTPVPTTDQQEVYFSNVTVLDSDSFEKDSGKWELSAAGGIADGKLLLLAKEWYPFVYSRPISDRQGISIEFSYSNDANFEFVFNNGDWGTDQYKRFGVYINNGVVNPNNPPNNIGSDGIAGGFLLKPDTTYLMMMAVLPGGEFLAVIRYPADPAGVLEYRKTAGAVWSGCEWVFSIGGDNGEIWFDNFTAFAFDGLMSS